MDRLLRGAALPVDRRPGYVLGEAGGEPRVASDVEGLLADLRDAAGDVVFDQARIDPGTADDLLQDLSQEIDRMEVLERAVPLADRRPNGLDDDGFPDLGHRWRSFRFGPPAARGLPRP